MDPAKANAQGNYYSKTIPADYNQEKMTNLHFFSHQTINAKNPSTVLVAQANKTIPFTFGSLYASNDALRVGVEPSSEVIGRAKGLFVVTGQGADFVLVFYMDFGFTTGKFNGSSFVLCSRDHVTETKRELAVVGGRGHFRMARGFAEVYTRYFNVTTVESITEYNVTLLHY
ncbi:hypothetical protein JCGZ_08418 [Jatropha curcas]|uniref:Dirigent protein n=1 Tax=Jatropha curcas TaxID=180498 RepID=A0A067KMQ7_JATCU|nr:hypothetical protein JCGZ_16235 [Jatropha curcas]KDP37412.1 hypothetical protein JCGZ_08418 [Jatropha curcas]